MGRAIELYRQRDTHTSIVLFLLFLTNCRYASTRQPNPECAIVPLVFQCVGVLAFMYGTEGARQKSLRIVSGCIMTGAVAACILSCIHIHHLLQATVAILNAYILLVLGIDLWAYQDNETVATPADIT